MVTKQLSERFDEVFPSSAGIPVLYSLPETHVLPTGEPYSHICLTSYGKPADEGIERGVCIVFSTGTVPSTLCGYRVSVHFRADCTLEAIHESVKRSLNGGGWSMRHTSYFPDQQRTEPWIFESAEVRISELLDIIHGLTPMRVPKTHPLLNSLGIRKVWME